MLKVGSCSNTGFSLQRWIKNALVLMHSVADALGKCQFVVDTHEEIRDQLQGQIPASCPDLEMQLTRWGDVGRKTLGNRQRHIASTLTLCEELESCH